MTWGPFNGNVNSRGTSNSTFRARGYITADARNQSEYGTVRGYIAVGISTSDVGLNTAANQFSANRAFIQWAGFTMGLSQSFFDYYSVPATSYWGAFPASDTGDPGWLVFGYTAQLGNGLSATLSTEERRVTQMINSSITNPGVAGSGTGGTLTPGAYVATLVGTGSGGGLFPGDGAYGGLQVGDFVGNLRVDQAWGGAQVMGALHQVNASYYGSTPGTGHPGDAWGWAAGVGFKINTPMIGQGDYLQTQFNVTQGALRYIFNTPNTNYGEVQGGREVFGVLSDGVYGGSIAGGNNTSVQLTSAWGFNAAYEHHWDPSWQTSVYGGYDKVSYNANANAMLCAEASTATAVFGSGSGSTALAGAGCNNNWSTWFIGSRTQWNVTKTFYMGVDVLYESLTGATTGGTSTVNNLGNYAAGGALLQEGSASAWLFRFRAHRDFLP
jgi:hypothetical protein